jgi:transposase
VPLVHPPGHAQADFGEAIGVIGGVERKIHFFAMNLPHSDAIFVAGYTAETTEAFCDGHVRAFAFFDAILYDNTKIAVARILGNGMRLRTRVFSELQSHNLFKDRFGQGQGRGARWVCAAELLRADPRVRLLRGIERASSGGLPEAPCGPAARP